MFDSRGEIVGWVLAVMVVAAMGIIVFTGPFHHINKTQAVSHLPPLVSRILDAPRTIGVYKPKDLRVHVGQGLKFTNNSSIVHTVTADDRSFDSGNIAIGGSWTFVPKKSGKFPYACIYHPLMVGTITVVP